MKNPLQLAELQKLAQEGGLSIKDLVNTKSQAYKKIQPDLSNMNEAAVFDLISANPRILIRPMLSDGKRLLLRFKDEEYREYIK